MRLTARGAGVAFATVALIGSGLGFGYPELTIIGAAAALALLGAFGWGLRRWTLGVQRVIDPDRVTRGNPCHGVVTVENTARWRGVDVIAFDRCGEDQVPVPMLRLGPARKTTTHYQLPTRRRGVVAVGPLRIERRDPLDLVRTSRDFGESARLWVHPETHQLRSVPAGAARSLDGQVDRIEHGNITFHALREYVPGDDLRQVHWRTSARVGQLMVREHIDTSLPRMLILLDDRPDPLDETGQTFEETIEVTASVLLAGLRDGLHVDLHLTSGALSLSSEAGRSPRMFLDALAEVEQVQGSLNEAVERLRLRRVGDTLVVLTGAGGESDVETVARLRSVYPSIVVGVMGRRAAGTRSEAGMLVISANGAADFAAAWDGVKAW